MQGVGKGFAHLRPLYTDFENPFKEGTFRTIETIKKGKESVAEWIPEIPRNGQYAVYVSYHTVPNSSDDALYTVHHKGGASQFKVNQQMGGGTWIYLGTFGFDAGQDNAYKVTLSNRSAKAGQTVTADAIKIGGGMGNIARRISEEGATDNLKSSDKPPIHRMKPNRLKPHISHPIQPYIRKAAIRVSAKPPVIGCNGQASRTVCIRKVRVRMITQMIIKAALYG